MKKYLSTYPVLIVLIFFISCSQSPTSPPTQLIDSAPIVTQTQLASDTPSPTQTATSKPTATATLVPGEDFDQDGLTNFEEMVKYKTDPYSADSDGDTITDGDWAERREYVYSVHVVMKIRPPFDIESMNDMFQDVRVEAEQDEDGYTLLDILIFPDTITILKSSPYPLINLPDDLIAFTEPGFSTNYSPEMQQEVMEIVKNAGNDVQAVRKILDWFDENTTLADLPYQPEVFYYTYLSDGNVYFRRTPRDIQESTLLTNLFYADSMFKNRVHGTCCSTATLKCSMIKAAGIPCKIIQTLFPIFSHEGQEVEYVNNLQRDWVRDFENQTGNSSIWANHCFMEVYLNGKWVRVDNKINIYHDSKRWLSVKILSVPDLTDVDFSLTYPVKWIHERPYYTLLVEDQYPINK